MVRSIKYPCVTCFQIRLLRYSPDGHGFVRPLAVLQFLLSSADKPVLSGHHHAARAVLYFHVSVGEVCSARI